MNRPSLMLKELREQLPASPPPAPHNASIREWFAGLALMNPVLMAGIPEEKRAGEAVRLADQLIAALATPRVPSLSTMAAPTEAEMEKWEQFIAENKAKTDLQKQDTVPAIMRSGKNRRATVKFGAVLPSPDGAALPPPASISYRSLPPCPNPVVRDRPKALPAPTNYSSILRER